MAYFIVHAEQNSVGLGIVQSIKRAELLQCKLGMRKRKKYIYVFSLEIIALL